MSHDTPNLLADLDGGALPSGKDLPYEDGEPMDSPWHREQMILLIHSLEEHWRDRNDFYVGGDMFVYYSLDQALNRDFRGPDFFVVLGVDKTAERLSWVVWEEGGHAPDVIVELLSPSTADIDRGVKMDVYARHLHTSEYFLYDPYEDTLEGWRLAGDAYVRIEPEANGRVRSERLDLYLGTWDGRILHTDTRWVRFFTPRGRLVPLPEEAATARADRAAARAKAAVAEAKAAAATARAEAARATVAEAEAKAAASKASAEADARALAEAEVARLKQELDALRKQAPPPP